MNSATRIAILGAGTWGTTLGALLAGKGLDVSVWSVFEEEASEAGTQSCTYAAAGRDTDLGSRMSRRNPQGCAQKNLFSTQEAIDRLTESDLKCFSLCPDPRHPIAMLN